MKACGSKEQRLSIKAELALRKKALTVEDFPNEEIIAEFLTDPPVVPNLNLNWSKPNIVKFIKQIGHLLQWPEIYCFQKFFPILTRWQVQQRDKGESLVEPLEIIKKRTVKGVASLELRWHDVSGCFTGLIPDEQIAEFELEHPKGVEELYYTIEPLSMLEVAYPDLVSAFLKSKEKPPKKSATRKKKNKTDVPLSALENLEDLVKASDAICEVATKPRRGRKKAEVGQSREGIQKINKFLKHKENTPLKIQPRNTLRQQCSTPITKCLPSDLDSDCDADFNMSDIVNGIISNPNALPVVTKHGDHNLHYEPLDEDLSMRLAQLSLLDKNESIRSQHFQMQMPLVDDSDLMLQKRRNQSIQETQPQTKRLSLDDSFDLLVKGDLKRVPHLLQQRTPIKTPVERFKRQHRLSTSYKNTPKQSPKNVSYFFDNIDNEGVDAFEQLMDVSMGHNELVVISDSD
ncbi:flap endonuclease GEN isoform X2 [Scaptodrosophila lebanonensis]|uniref:Flap endonuclease GEN isoform X2 n=1 Tax=Drosophila lebanonensis TaxID=7225 RepID=A0A6J2TBW1_DROLE|nr:flap endonuclease GEN isoform X2 [Scaptodrosophila lebanonensis]